MRRWQQQGFTEIACCTFCGSRNVLKPPNETVIRCTACARVLEFHSRIACPHCKGEAIQVSVGRDPEAGSFLKCSACDRQIADGVPLIPKVAPLPVWMLRLLADAVGRLFARNRPPKYQYQPKLACACFRDLHASWRSESEYREKGRQGQRRPRENDLTVYACPGEDEQIKRSRQIVLSRHTALLDKYEQYLSAFLSIAHGRIYQDEYGDEIWEQAKKEIEKIIDDKIFKQENIRDREEFYSFEFLSRCEPYFESEYSDCWIFDELYDRLKAYHETRLQALTTAGDLNPDKLSGIEFEQWLIASIKQAGIVDVKPTRRTGDQGADIIVRQGRVIVVQAKCYQQALGNAAVQEVYAAKGHYGADEAWVVTNSRFTRAARELAQSTGVRLVDRSSFREIGSLIARAVALEDPLLRAEWRVNDTAVPGNLRSDRSMPTEPTLNVPDQESNGSVSRGSAALPEPHKTQPVAETSFTPESVPSSVRKRRGDFSRRTLYRAVVCVILVILAIWLAPHGSTANDRAVRAVIDRWVSSTLSLDIQGQLACYAPRLTKFYRLTNVDFADVAKIKREAFNQFLEARAYRLRNLTFEHLDAHEARVVFDKDWDFRNRATNRRFAGSGRQRLTLKTFGKAWLITGEEELAVYTVTGSVVAR